jgi:hypothetical protein
MVAKQSQSTNSTNTTLRNTQPEGQTRTLLEPVHLTKKQKLANRLVGFALGLTAVALGILLFWSFTGKDVLDMHNTPLPVQPIVVKADEKILVTADFCKKVATEGTMYVRFVSDRTELVVPTTTENLGARCYNNLAFPVPIPPQTVPGVYHLNYRIDYKTNPITTVREVFNTQNFTVTE